MTASTMVRLSVVLANLDNESPIVRQQQHRNDSMCQPSRMRLAPLDHTDDFIEVVDNIDELTGVVVTGRSRTPRHA
jgi:hypothetical protein